MTQHSRKMFHGGAVFAATLFAFGAPVLQAQTMLAAADTGDSTELSEVIVTGTRQSGLEAADSPSPIQILSPAAMEAASGNPDLMQTLAQIVPSLTVQAFGFDMSNQTVQAKLKGLSPNHVLVLVDGKRRHTTANLAVDTGSTYQGGASADLNFIPQAAIDHIEVLTEGAAAQYGSDAIAGVINIILKKASSGGTVTGTYGAYYDGGPPGAEVPWSFNGTTTAATANVGFEPLENSFLNLTLEIHNHGHTCRCGADSRQTDPTKLATFPDSNAPQSFGYPYTNWIEGDAEVHSKLAEYNAGYNFDNGMQFYSFGTYGTKNAASFQNYRAADVLAYTDPATGVTNYTKPFGFDPREGDDEIDYGVTAGIKGTFSGFNWDVSTTWGRDHHDVFTLDSGNPGIYDTTGLLTPNDFYDGNMIATQWTNNVDVNRDFEVGMASPLNVAVGAEFRHDFYKIGAGEPEAYLGGGPSSFAGFAPTDAGSHDRKNYAGYVDLAGKPIDPLLLDLAGRYEHFSDFGNATVGKFTARYDFAPQFAIRGTISNGFRAPTLAEEYYSSTNVGPSSTFVQLPPNGAGAQVLGLGNLQPEKSTNLSIGFVFRPLPAMSATLDIYRIRVTNRIVGSGSLYGLLNGAVISPLVNATINATGDQINPIDTTTGITLFTNGINTTTNGVDLSFQFPTDFTFGHVDWTASATINDTQVTYIRPVAPDLSAALNGSPLYSAQSLSDLSTASPKYVINFGALWTYGRFGVNVLEKIYGPSSEYDPDNGDNPSNTLNYIKSTIGTTPITNIDLSYKLNKWLKFNIGAMNVFNRYPPQLNPILIKDFNSHIATLNNDASSSAPYPLFSPFGIDGGFYYAKASFSF